MTKGQRLVLTPAGQIEIEEFDVPLPASNQVLVRTHLTQVSAGSEMNGIRRRRSASAAEQAGSSLSGWATPPSASWMPWAKRSIRWPSGTV